MTMKDYKSIFENILRDKKFSCPKIIELENKRIPEKLLKEIKNVPSVLRNKKYIV